MSSNKYTNKNFNLTPHLGYRKKYGLVLNMVELVSNELREVVNWTPFFLHCWRWSCLVIWFTCKTSSEDQEHTKIVLWVGFLISSIIVVCLNVLFFCIYNIDGQKNCITVDRKIKNVSLGARSVTDFILLLEVAYKIYSSSILELCPNSKTNVAPLTFFGRLTDVSKRVSWMDVLVDFFGSTFSSIGSSSILYLILIPLSILDQAPSTFGVHSSANSTFIGILITLLIFTSS